ncbi:hypothetical protein PG996_001532 [Apiospora saccharicola]|uniref:Lipocalin-like domain-containing protein n=1 Tax=Apiospora saccharicola TaxID=335842 RepID=A0ABR1WGW5_9PEZI
MAAPASKTIGDLNGTWVMNKNLSDPTEPGLALQGIGYLTRKAIGFATVTLSVKQYSGAPLPPSTAGGECVHIDIEQTATGGIKGTSENRCTDAVKRTHSDWLFGTVDSHSYFDTAGDLKKAVLAHGVDAASADYLAANWLEGETEKTGPEGAAHLVSVADNQKDGWIAVQVWGFQTIGGERRYARNIVLRKGDKKVEMRLIYDFIS